MNVLEGKLVSSEMKIGIVVSRFNEFITSRLLSGAVDALSRHDVADDCIDVAWVPGAFEIPLIASKMAKSGKYDAVICLGAVIRGQPLRLRMQRSIQRHRAGIHAERYPCDVRRGDHRKHRAGHRTGRHQSGQQRL